AWQQATKLINAHAPYPLTTGQDVALVTAARRAAIFAVATTMLTLGSQDAVNQAIALRTQRGVQPRKFPVGGTRDGDEETGIVEAQSSSSAMEGVRTSDPDTEHDQAVVPTSQK